MGEGMSALAKLRDRLQTGAVTPAEAAAEAQGRADHSEALKGTGCGTYIWRNAQQAIAYAETLPKRFPNAEKRPPLYGVPVSVKGLLRSCWNGDRLRFEVLCGIPSAGS